MAALTGITAVRTTANTGFRNRKYGATVAPGVPLYLDSTDGELKLADNDASAITATCAGISITDGIDGGTGIVAHSGDIELIGTTMVVGTDYYAGSSPGTIVPSSDLTTGMIVCRLGTAATATRLSLDIQPTGIVHA